MSSFVETKKYWQGVEPFPLKACLQVTYPLLKWEGRERVGAAHVQTACLLMNVPLSLQQSSTVLCVCVCAITVSLLTITIRGTCGSYKCN